MKAVRQARLESRTSALKKQLCLVEKREGAIFAQLSFSFFITCLLFRKPVGFIDHAAYYSVVALRKSFDLASGYTIGKQLQTLDERSVVIRCIFLETVAGKQ